MKKILKRFASVGMAGVLLAASLLSLTRVYATEYGEGEYMLHVGMDELNGATINSLTVNGYNWTGEDDEFRTADGQYTIDIDYTLAAEDAEYDSQLMTGGNTDPYFAQVGGAGGPEAVMLTYSFDLAAAIANEGDINRLSLMIWVDRGDEPEPQGDTDATLRLRGGDGEWTRGDDVFSYAETYPEVSVSINGGWFWRAPVPVNEMGEPVVPEYIEDTYIYYSDPEDETVDMTFETLWHYRLVDTIVINGTSYTVADYINYDDQEDWWNHYSGQTVGFMIEGVAKADVYDITVKARERLTDQGEQDWAGNFLWTADPEQEWEKDCYFDGEQDVCEYRLDDEGNRIPGRDYIGHSSLSLVAVEYTVGNTTYACNADTLICAWWPVDDEENVESCSLEDPECAVPYIEFNSGNGEYDDGSLVIPAGASVTMRIIPDYGYQVMNVNMVGGVETNDDGVGEFTFTVPGGAAYFVADVVEMEDTVVADAEAVTDGAIDLGDGQTTIDHGTAQLEVNDVDLSDEDIAGFEDAAGDYNISTYLDISLYNITCKGGETCDRNATDAWVDQIHDLNEAATITLQLADDVDGNEIVIVHQKHDGTYEVIPTIYDPVAHTLTFTTSSFSNYAIASKTVAPDTGAFTGEAGAKIAIGAMALIAATTVAGAIMVVVYKRTR